MATRKNKNYFIEKGFDTILSYSEIIKESTFKTVFLMLDQFIYQPIHSLT